MAHEVKYRYRAYMPIDGTRNIVHIEALTPGLSYRFIAFEKKSWGLCVVGVLNAPDDALHLDTKKTDEKAIKTLLAEFNHHDEYNLEEIEIELHPDLCITVTGSEEPFRPLTRKMSIPDSNKYPPSRR